MKRILKKWLKNQNFISILSRIRLILFFRFFSRYNLIFNIWEKEGEYRTRWTFWTNFDFQHVHYALCIDLSIFTTTKLHIQLDCSRINKPYLISEPFQSSNLSEVAIFLIIRNSFPFGVFYWNSVKVVFTQNITCLFLFRGSQNNTSSIINQVKSTLRARWLTQCHYYLIGKFKFLSYFFTIR